MGVQLIPDSDEFVVGFDLLDATDIVSEEQVPVRPVSSLVLDRNPAEARRARVTMQRLAPRCDGLVRPLRRGRAAHDLEAVITRCASEPTGWCGW
jgi:catalase